MRFAATLRVSLYHFSNPVASKRDQHLTLTCWFSLMPLGPLTCTDLPSDAGLYSGTKFSEGVQIFQKNLFGGEPIIGGEGSKLNVTGSLFCILGCNMVRSTIPVVCGQSLYSLLANLRLFHRQLVIFHLGTKLNHLAHHTIATPHCTMLCIYLSAVCIC